jgi:hypothetical protein
VVALGEVPLRATTELDPSFSRSIELNKPIFSLLLASYGGPDLICRLLFSFFLYRFNRNTGESMHTCFSSFFLFH